MVAAVASKFIYLIHETPSYRITTLRDICLMAAWGHDLIEDTRTNFNEVKSNLGIEVAEVIYAVTNEKGKTRQERANAEYYRGIRETPGATFVKLCDRIANVQYSKMTQSRMFEMYKNENPHFLTSLGYADSPLFPYYDMVIYLDDLFIPLW
jgi:(p)ppGpp synthase/HD superfamily hydrolase